MTSAERGTAAFSSLCVLVRRLGLMLLFVSSLLVSASLVGKKIPDVVQLDFGFPPEKVPLAERVAGKKVILVGLPGAFTPT